MKPGRIHAWLLKRVARKRAREEAKAALERFKRVAMSGAIFSHRREPIGGKKTWR